jgi:hypothetical protein
MAQEVPHDLTLSALRVVPDSTNNNVPALEVSGKTELLGRTEVITGTLHNRRPTDITTWGTSASATSTLTAAQSGTLFQIDGTANNVVNMPALSTANAGLYYDFILTAAVGGATTTTFVLPGAGVSNFAANLILVGDAATCTVTQDLAGDTLTLVNNTAAGATVRLDCLKDDGTNSTWKATVISTPVATVG